MRSARGDLPGPYKDAQENPVVLDNNQVICWTLPAEPMKLGTIAKSRNLGKQGRARLKRQKLAQQSPVAQRYYIPVRVGITSRPLAPKYDRASQLIGSLKRRLTEMEVLIGANTDKLARECDVAFKAMESRSKRTESHIHDKADAHCKAIDAAMYKVADIGKDIAALASRQGGVEHVSRLEDRMYLLEARLSKELANVPHCKDGEAFVVLRAFTHGIGSYWPQSATMDLQVTSTHNHLVYVARVVEDWRHGRLDGVIVHTCACRHQALKNPKGKDDAEVVV